MSAEAGHDRAFEPFAESTGWPRSPAPPSSRPTDERRRGPCLASELEQRLAAHVWSSPLCSHRVICVIWLSRLGLLLAVFRFFRRRRANIHREVRGGPYPS
jgi:hypothetical protein